MKHRDDSGGYTLQTIIVSSILLVVATIASVALYRAITTSADVRSIADLRSDTDERTPAEPHGFTVDYIIKDGQYNATINWSNPLYTGTPQLGSSASSLRYKTSGYCQPPPSNSEPPPSTTTITLPSVTLPPLEAPISAADDKDCTLQVQPYDCPSPDENCEENQGILGAEAEYNFALRRAASAPQNLSVRVVDSDLLVSWDTPENIGSGEIGETLFYEIDNEADTKKCTPNNYSIIPVADTTKLTVTSYVTAPGEDPPTFKDDNCPNPNLHLTITEDQSENNSIAEAVRLGRRVQNPTLTISPATSDDLVNDDSLNAYSLVRAGRFDDIVIAKLTWNEDENADSFLLRWSRVDGIGEPRSLEIDSSGEQRIFLRLENGVAYNFSLWARNSIEEKEANENCIAVGSHSPNARPLKPDVDAQQVGTDGTGLLVRIAVPGNMASCQPVRYCTASNCAPAESLYFKLRITETCLDDESTSNFPYKNCGGNDPVYCISASSNITEIILPLPLDAEKRTVEVIASIQNLCGDDAGDVGVLDGGAEIEFESATSLPAYTTYS